MAIYRDITEFRREQRRFRALIEHVSDIVVVVGEDLEVRYISPSVEALLGYRPDELVGRNALEVITIEEPQRYEEMHRRAGATHTVSPPTSRAAAARRDARRPVP